MSYQTIIANLFFWPIFSRLAKPNPRVYKKRDLRIRSRFSLWNMKFFLHSLDSKQCSKNLITPTFFSLLIQYILDQDLEYRWWRFRGREKTWRWLTFRFGNQESLKSMIWSDITALTSQNLSSFLSSHFWLRKEPKKCRCCLSVGESVGPHYALQFLRVPKSS